MKIKIKLLHPDAKVPTYATPGASGFDLVAIEDVRIRSGETKLIKTGIAVDVGYKYELQVRPRSGMSLKTNFRVANSPGTVDSDFRGEICVIMTNTGGMDWDAINPWYKGRLIKKGERIAQGVICPIEKAVMIVVDSLDNTDRGDGGFGSTGK